MSKKENGSTTNSKHRAKKIIKLIIYIVLLGLLAFISVKSCNITLKALTPSATSWDDLNNVNIMCNVNGNLSNELDTDEYYYLNNGNNTSGLSQSPAFSIYDTYTGFQYDEIRIRQTDIYLRGYLYDSQDNFSDYYERVIWANDYIGENIIPDTIRFENLSSDTASNIPGANVYYPNALNPFSAFLNIINISFTTAYTETNIFDGYIDDFQRIDLYILETPDGLQGYKLYYYDEDSESENVITIIRTADINYILNNLNQTITIDVDGDALTIYYTQGTNEIDFRSQTITIETPVNYESFNLYNWAYSLNCVKNYIEQQAETRGYSTGYSVGRSVGEEIGYQEGYDDGASNSLNTSWVLSLMNTATSILYIEIFPGFKLIYLVGAFIILMFVRFVIGWVR